MPKQHLTAVVGADTRRFNMAMGMLRAGVRRMGVAIGAMGAAAGAGFVKLVQSAIKYGDGISDSAKRTGIGAEALQRLQFAADMSGTSLANLEMAVKKSSKVVFDANSNMGDAKKTLDSLGLSAAELGEMTPEKQLDAFMIALAGVAKATERTALAQDVFGRSGTSLLPMLEGGAAGYRSLMAEADKFNVILSNDQVAAAAAADDAMTRLRASLKALGFGAVLLDGQAFADMIDGLAMKVADFSGGGGMQSLNDTLHSLADILAVIWDLTSKIAGVLGSVGKVGESMISGLGLTDTGFSTNQLASGTGQFGAADPAALVLARLDMMMRNGLPVVPQEGGR